jgi:hypothetical protein
MTRTLGGQDLIPSRVKDLPPSIPPSIGTNASFRRRMKIKRRNHLPLPRAGGENIWCITTTFPYVFMIRCVSSDTASLSQYQYCICDQSDVYLPEQLHTRYIITCHLTISVYRQTRGICERTVGIFPLFISPVPPLEFQHRCSGRSRSINTSL